MLTNIRPKQLPWYSPPELRIMSANGWLVVWHSRGIPFSNNPFHKGIPGIKPINHQLTQDLIRGSQDLNKGIPGIPTTTFKPKPTNLPFVESSNKTIQATETCSTLWTNLSGAIFWIIGFLVDRRTRKKDTYGGSEKRPGLFFHNRKE